MQQTIFQPDNLPQIANPSLFEHLVFESGSSSGAILFASTLVVAIILHKAGKSRPALIVGMLGLFASIGIFTASSLVTTDREHIADRLESLVNATAQGDESTLRSLLSESVSVRTAFADARGRDQVVQLATTRAAPMITQVHASDIRVGLSGPRVARSTVKVKATSDSPMGLSIWIVDWSRADEETSEWVATDIEPFWIQGMSNPTGP